MQHVKPKWRTSGLVLVCRKCFQERIPDEDPQTAAQIGDFDLRDWLKQRLKADGHWGRIRAVGTTCMDVCARRHVTVTIVPQDGRVPEVFVVDPLGDREELYGEIIERLT